jgi:hypothetical protein
MALKHIVAKKTLVYIVLTVTLDHIVTFVIALVALLTSSPMMWRKEHLWNVSVLQRVGLHLSNLIKTSLCPRSASHNFSKIFSNECDHKRGKESEQLTASLKKP